MPTFSDSFWSSGYSTGLNVIFDKLRQGCVENDEVLALAAARADSEEAYGNRLLDIPTGFTIKKTGFGRDDGASLRKAYEGITDEMGNEGKQHVQVAESIRRMVILPFGKWSDDHKKRVEYSASILRDKLKMYEKELAEVQKAQRKYFNKCRVLEETRNVDGEGRVGGGIGGGTGSGSDSAPNTRIASIVNSTVVSRNVSNASTVIDKGKGKAIVGGGSNPGSNTNTTVPPIQPITPPEESLENITSKLTSTSFDELDEDPVELGENIYTPDEAKVLFEKMLDEIPQKSLKVSILGTYEHVSTGAGIVAWVQHNMSKDVNTSLQDAEKFGQSLINEGFLRLVGQVGSKFANSSVMNYQWKRKAFQVANRLEKSTNEQPFAPYVGEYLGETINNYINNPHADETPEERLIREVNELDLKYRQVVQNLDDVRCNLEELIIDHLTFMERCELDRLKAIKAVFLDFLAALSNVIPTIQVSVDKLLLYQETVQPANDLRYVLESYRTGYFQPKVTIYDNYYNTAEDQIFGVELEYRCRGDKKKVPYIVIQILGFMDSQYPIMENDEKRLSTWVVSVPLRTTHQLRRELNNNKNVKLTGQILSKYEPATIVSVLKIYLVELPDSIVPSSLYDTIKNIYSEYGNDEDPTNRLKVVKNCISQLRVSNIATLDAIIKHLGRLTSIAKASDEYIGQLAQEFSNCLLRPKQQSALTLGDRHAFLLVKDLILHKGEIFDGLRRQMSNRKASSSSSLSPSPSLKKEEVPQINRRPTLQNRMDALSLRIRKGTVGENDYSDQQKEYDNQQEQVDFEEHQAHIKQEEQYSQSQSQSQTYSTPTTPEAAPASSKMNKTLIPPVPTQRPPRSPPIPVKTIESFDTQENEFYDAEEGEVRHQPLAGRQDESLTNPINNNEGVGIASHPIIID